MMARIPDWLFMLIGQLFVSACATAASMLILYLALGLYGLILTRLVNYVGATAAFVAFCREKRNRGARWQQWIDWTIRGWRNE
jgi:hypothetical protein